MKFDKKMLYYYGFLFGLGILIGYGITDICYRVYCAMRWLFMRPTKKLALVVASILAAKKHINLCNKIEQMSMDALKSLAKESKISWRKI